MTSRCPLFASSLLLALLVGGTFAGCKPKPPEGTTPPADGGGTPSSSGGAAEGEGDGGAAPAAEGGRGGKGGKGGKAPPAADPTQKVCEAEVSDTPTKLFMDTVFIRTPKNVVIVEMSPFFAMTGDKPVSTCDGMVNRMAIALTQTDPAKDLKVVRDEFMTANGYVGGAWKVEKDEPEHLEAIGEYAEHQGAPPAKVFLVVKRKYEKDWILFYETHPNAWNALHKSFRESARRLIIKPPPK